MYKIVYIILKGINLKNENLENDNNVKTVVIQQQSQALGICSFIFGLISIFLLSVIFVPLGLICGRLGIYRKQYLWSSLGLVCTTIGFFTSPMLMLMIFGSVQ